MLILLHQITELWKLRKFYVNKTTEYLSKINMESWSKQLKKEIV